MSNELSYILQYFIEIVVTIKVPITKWLPSSKRFKDKM